MKFENSKLGQFLFPDTCLICHRSHIGNSGIPYLCRQCLGRLPWRSHDGVMPWPEDLKQSWSQVLDPEKSRALELLVQKGEILVACDYEHPIRDGLLALKFSDASEWHRLFAGLLALTVRRQRPSYSAVAAVPLHAQRLAERGYNQAGLLVRELARELNLPDWSEFLLRTRQTERQSAQISRQDRIANLSGAFAWNGPDNLQPARILLVDDVLTTGATLTAAAEPLFLAGAQVTGVVVASNHHPLIPTSH